MPLNARGISYLKCIEDWSAAFEVAFRLGDVPRKPVKLVSSTLHRFVGRGLAEHHEGNNTFRLTDAGRTCLTQQNTR